MPEKLRETNSRNLPTGDKPSTGALTYLGETKPSVARSKFRLGWLGGVILLLVGTAAAYFYWQSGGSSKQILTVEEVRSLLRNPDAISSQVLIREGQGLVDVQGVISETTVDEVPVLTLRSAEGTDLDLEVTQTPLEELAEIKETDTVTARCRIPTSYARRLEECELLAVKKL